MRRAILTVVIASAYSWLYLVDIDSVPFHPDESSWIFMSGDFDAIVRGDVGRLVWVSDQAITDEIRLRLLNAPLAKYVIGAGRWVGGYGAERNGRWDWLQTWDQNGQAGAMPSPGALRVSRRTVAVAAVLSLAIMFWFGWEVVGPGAAAIGTGVLALHPLTMVHARRAMAEGPAQLFVIIAVFAVLHFVVAADRASQTAQWRRAAVIAGSAIGLAIAAKQNAVAVAALGLLAGVLVPFSGGGLWRARLFAGAWVACVVIIASGVVYVAVSPVMYRDPVLSARVMMALRQILSRNQAAQTATVAPELATPTLASRARTAYENVYWLPPAFSEYPDYDGAIAPQIATYRSQPLLRSASSRPVRLGFLTFTVLGLFSVLRDVIRDRLGPRTRGGQLLIAWLATQVGFVILALPMGWQRYYLPLLPPLCLIAGVGVVQSLWAFNRRVGLLQRKP